MMAGSASEVSRYWRNELGRFEGLASCQFIHPHSDFVINSTCDHAWHCDAEHTNYLYRLRRSIRYRLSNCTAIRRVQARSAEDGGRDGFFHEQIFGTVYLRAMVLRPKGSELQRSISQKQWVIYSPKVLSNTSKKN